MQAIRQLASDNFGSCRLTTSEIKSVDGTPLFSTVFFEGTPANRYDGAPFKNKLTTSEAEALAHHAKTAEAVRAGWKA